jgi:acyl carrier protein
MSVDKVKIQEELSAYLYRRFLASDVEIQPTDKFADIGVDSMTVVELVMFIEEEFGIVIPADQLTGDNLATLESLTACAIQNQID